MSWRRRKRQFFKAEKPTLRSSDNPLVREKLRCLDDVVVVKEAISLALEAKTFSGKEQPPDLALMLVVEDGCTELVRKAIFRLLDDQILRPHVSLEHAIGHLAKEKMLLSAELPSQ